MSFPEYQQKKLNDSDKNTTKTKKSSNMWVFNVFAL